MIVLNLIENLQQYLFGFEKLISHQLFVDKRKSILLRPKIIARKNRN